MSLITDNAPGILQSITATIICAGVAYGWNRFFGPKASTNMIVPGRNIWGYVCGWLLMTVIVPLAVYSIGEFQQDTLVQLVVIDAASISVIGWLDRYSWVRKNFGGSKLWESLTLPLLSFPIAGLIIMVLGGITLKILNLIARLG